jgi:hypothetical protein
LNDKYGFINKKGKFVIEPQFYTTGNFSEGLAYVEKGGEYGYIDKTGKYVIELKYSWAVDFSNGLAKVYFSDDEYSTDWGYIDKTGKAVWQTTEYYDDYWDE